MRKSITLSKEINLTKLDLLCLKMKQKEIETQKQLYKVLEFNTDGIITNIEDKFLQLIGLKKEDLEGEHFSSFISASSLELSWEKIIDGIIISDEFVFQSGINDTIKVKGFFEAISKSRETPPYKIVLKILLP